MSEATPEETAKRMIAKIDKILRRYGLRGGWSSEIQVNDDDPKLQVALRPVRGRRAKFNDNDAKRLLERIELWAARRTADGRRTDDGVAV